MYKNKTGLPCCMNHLSKPLSGYDNVTMTVLYNSDTDNGFPIVDGSLETVLKNLRHAVKKLHPLFGERNEP